MARYPPGMSKPTKTETRGWLAIASGGGDVVDRVGDYLARVNDDV